MTKITYETNYELQKVYERLEEKIKSITEDFTLRQVIALFREEGQDLKSETKIFPGLRLEKTLQDGFLYNRGKEYPLYSRMNEAHMYYLSNDYGLIFKVAVPTGLIMHEEPEMGD